MSDVVLFVSITLHVLLHRYDVHMQVSNTLAGALSAPYPYSRISLVEQLH